MDYVYIDEHNKVHLLLAVTAGDKIGMDNTCKSALELKTFFYGEVKQTRQGEKKVRNSAKENLQEYRGKLIHDIDLLKTSEYQELLAQKQTRLKQIEAYIEIIEKTQSTFVDPDTPHPKIPLGIHRLFAKKSNCLYVLLSPHEPDLYLRGSNHIFSLERTSSWTKPCFKNKLLDKLGEHLVSSKESKSSKNMLITEAAKQLSAKPTLKILQNFLQNKIKELFHVEEVNLNIATTGAKLEGYLRAMNLSYNDCETTEEAANLILNACLNEEFWDGLVNNNFFNPDYKEYNEYSARLEANRLGMALQFFWGKISVYCYEKGLSTQDFGEILDQSPYDAEITSLIINSLPNTQQVQTAIFNYINAHLTEFRMKQALSNEDQMSIVDGFNEDYRLIKNSPNFDEFMLFNPNIPGDFFNHHNKISVHFLDLIHYSDLSSYTSHNIQSIIDSAKMNNHVELLKEATVRRLPPNNRVSNNFLDLQAQDFRAYIAEDPQRFAEELYKKCIEQPQWSNSISFELLDSLYMHPKWGQIQKIILEKAMSEGNSFIPKIMLEMKSRWSIYYDEMFSTKQINLSNTINDENWLNAENKLGQLITIHRNESTNPIKIAMITQLENNLIVLASLDPVSRKTGLASTLYLLSQMINTLDHMDAARTFMIKPSQLKIDLQDLKSSLEQQFELKQSATPKLQMPKYEQPVEQTPSNKERFKASKERLQSLQETSHPTEQSPHPDFRTFQKGK